MSIMSLSPRPSATIIGEGLSGSLRKRARRSVLWTIYARGTIYPDVIEVRPGQCRHHPRATTTWAACPTLWISRRSSSPCGCCSRTRSGSWAGRLGLPECLVTRQPSRARTGHPHHRRHHQGEGGHPPGRRCHLPGGDCPGGLGQQDQPVFCGADQYALCGRHGRRPHLRLHPGPAGVTTSDFYDRRLGPDSL